MTRKAKTTLVSAVLLAALAAGPGSSAALAQAPTNEALVSYVGAKKIKVGNRMTYDLSCSAACNVVVSDVILGPKFKDAGKLPGTLLAGVPVSVIIKPNGPLLKALKAFPGRFKVQSSVTATDPATGATDTDTRTFGFK